MLEMRIAIEGDSAWPDLREREIIHLANDAPPIRVGALQHGMVSGNTSVAIVLELPDGKVVFAETSLRLFLAAASAFQARYGDE